MISCLMLATQDRSSFQYNNHSNINPFENPFYKNTIICRFFCDTLTVLCDCDLAVLILFSFKTSTISLWILYDLACHPEVQEKMYEEVSGLLGSHGDFTPMTFSKLKYVKACIKESLR